MGSFFRKPLGVFVAILVVGFVCIGLGMTALGGTSGSPDRPPEPLTRAQFQRVGDRLGRSLCLQLKPIVNKKPHSLRQLTSGIRRISAIFDRFRIRLYALIPPPARARAFYRLRNKLDAADNAMDHADHLAETRQWRRFVLYVRSKQFKDIGRRLGPADGKLRCGQGGHTAA